MTHEEYLERRAKYDEELKAKGIALVVDDPLEAEYFDQTVMQPFREALAMTLADLDKKDEISLNQHHAA